MATVTGLTAARMLEIEAMSIVNGAVDLSTGVLTLQRHDGSTVVAGNVRGVGLQPGGLTGQTLVKKTNLDYDAEWRDVHEVPSGGTTGQAFFKKSNANHDAEWRDISTSDIKTGVFPSARIPTLSADKVDVLFHSSDNITILRSISGTNATGGAVFVSPNEFGAVFNNEWKVRFDSAGVMTAGKVNGNAIVGGPGSIDPFVVPCYGRDAANGASWWTTDRGGGWGSGTRMVFNSYAIANSWHFGFWNANGDEEILVGHDGQRYFRASGIYARTTTAGANVAVGGSGELYRTVSLRDSKTSIEDAPNSWVDKVWSLQPRTWFDRGDAERLAAALDREQSGIFVDWSDEMVSPLRRIPGFVAEEVEAAGLEEFLTRDETGELTGLAYDRLSAALLVAMKDERQKRLDAETRLTELENKLEVLTSRLEALEE